ncbi:methanol oxidation system protein MoxJ [Methylophilaceae bacterium 11]|jgi:mxaJ protein|uniref:methanol oxidation system protein MoxJ n=1 Tax=unclassified Methylotenera TaxID=2643294 RepID=UPI000366E845|nr:MULTISPECIES: methanol oxidation system protein MoxJ [unclassified Methylotenera]EUJ10659.1 methanol oxidation system protein MoxJ [Methylophilaceae bacterium 11]
MFKKQQVFSLFSMVAGVLCFLATQAHADELRVCAGENEMPFSNVKKEGFENALAEVIGQGLNKKVEFVFWKDPRYSVRDFLDKNKCDVVFGMDAADPRVLKTKPYFKSGYVFVTKEDREIDISSWNDEMLKAKSFRIGVLPDSPGKVMLLQINRFDDMFDYFAEIQGYKSTRNNYIRVEPSRLVNDVESQVLHAAELWAPEAARYVREAKTKLKMQLIKDDAKKSNGVKVPMHYDVVMGVRKGDTELQQALNKVIDDKKVEIEAVLKKEGIPLL